MVVALVTDGDQGVSATLHEEIAHLGLRSRVSGYAHFHRFARRVGIEPTTQINDKRPQGSQACGVDPSDGNDRPTTRRRVEVPSPEIRPVYKTFQVSGS